jgi:nicotinamide-nucleotide amidase
MGSIEHAEILAVGTELISLGREDTNSVFLTRRLADLGIAVHAKSVVADRRADLEAVLRAALQRAPLVITTGGLGPTDDDLTREVAAEIAGWPLREHPELLAAIEERFRLRGVPMPAINRRQAMVPDGAVALDNPNGSAPGLLFELGDRLLVLLPGPPREMQPMFESHVVPRLDTRTTGHRVRRRVIRVTGRSESQVEELANPVYSLAPPDGISIETTILASPGQIELHLSASGLDAAALDRFLEARVTSVVGALGQSVFSTDGRSLEAVVGHLLEARGWRIAVAESCTGGLLLGRLTDVPGSSTWVVGGIVAYDNQVKIASLSVDAAVLARDGAVSEAVARAMAEGVRRSLGTDVGVGVTGIAGPGGGSVEKPVGSVAIAVTAGASPTVSKMYRFPGDREMVRRFATSAALDLVRAAVER